MFRIEMLPAGHGDCLWIEYGTQSAPRRVLIDGGTAPTYDILRARIADLPVAQRQLELIVVTHIDADHIEGVVRLLRDEQLGLQVGDIWYNGWKHLFVRPPSDHLGPVQGEFLSALIRTRQFPWNQAFDGDAAAASLEQLSPIILPGGLQLTLLSPSIERLTKLRQVWEREVKKAGLDPDDSQAALRRLAQRSRLRPRDALGGRPDIRRLARAPQKSDNSVANGSSIAFLAQYEDKRCLFGADAHPRTIETAVRHILGQTGNTRLKIDAFKIAHHGGQKNLTTDLLKLLQCDRFLVSTNGDRYRHPDPEAIARIILHGGREPTLYFNYRSEHNQMWNDRTLMRKHNYRALFPGEAQQGLAVEL